MDVTDELVLLHRRVCHDMLVDTNYTLMCLWETGRLTAAELVNAGGARTLRPPANKYALIAAVAREPWRISIDIAREFRLFQRTVFRVLRNDQLHPCSSSLSTRLFPECRAVWMDVYEWIHQQSADDRLSTKFCGQTKCFFFCLIVCSRP